jgi:DNA topoisomerase-3
LYPRKSKPDGDENADAQALPEFQVGESGPHEPEVRQGETTPPKHFTENTLLAMMETDGRLVDDQQLREALKERGLGTPATRAAIIETLLQRRYIERSKKLLIATDLGRYLIAVVRGEDLKSPELTGRWEAKLREIESGKLAADGFMTQIADFARSIIHQDQERQIDSQRWGTCPRCGREVIQGKRGFGCSGWREGCGFVIWPDGEGRTLTPLQVRQLLQLGLTAEPHPLPTGAAAVFALTATGEIVEIPLPEATGQRAGKPVRASGRGSRPPAKPLAKTASADGEKSLGACPLCQSDVREQKKSYSCSRWKEGCPFVIWKTISGKKIGVRSARLLLRKGETSLLKGFQSKSGKPFSARLRLDNGLVKFVFDD